MLKIKIPFLIAAALFSLALQAGDPVADLHRYLSVSKTIRSEFKQTVTAESGELVQQSHGTIAFQRPNKIHWEADTPFHYLMVSDGETLWRYDADLEQLSTEPFDPRLADTPALIFAASAKELAENYDITVQKVKQGGTSFILKPHSSDLFSELTLQFRGESLVGMVLLDNLEQRTEIQFIDPEYNLRLPSSLFQFSPSTEQSAQ